MTAIYPNVLDYFKSHRNEEVFQFLTWYMILVKQVNFDDIIEFVMKPTEYNKAEHLVYKCYITTKTGLELILTIERMSIFPWHCTGVERHQREVCKGEST